MSDLHVSHLNARYSASPNINNRLTQVIRVPTAVIWNRLEGRPRSADLTRPMRAEIRDPLWMLARQWQLGEFEGEDAGMPTQAHLAEQKASLYAVQLGTAAATPYDATRPLEALVEARPVVFDLMSSLQLGTWWRQELQSEFDTTGRALLTAFRTHYGIAHPAPTPEGERPSLETMQLATHRRELEVRLAVSGNGIDGAAVFADAASDDPIAAFRGRGISISQNQANRVEDCAARFVKRVRALFAEPPLEHDAWNPNRLDYALAIAAPDQNGTQTVLEAPSYAGGRLDWYSFDAHRGKPIFEGHETRADGVRSSDRPAKAVPFIPTPLSFAGMPNVRWWEVETNRVGFGLTTAAKTDLVKMLLAQFGTVAGNDWFVVPRPGSVATLVDVDGILVADNFGVLTFVEPTAKRHKDLGFAGTWTIWRSTVRDPQPGEAPVLLAPTLPRSHESKPVEETLFLRDETANLVWGVEAIIPDPLGGGRSGPEAGRRLREVILRAYGTAASGTSPVSKVKLRYQLMSTIPENWIPFVSAQVTGAPGSTVLLQGAMPRIPPVVPTAPEAAGSLGNSIVLPRGSILSQNPLEPNAIHDEEILRDGLLIRRTYQMTRWTGFTRYAWTGFTRRNGRGEGSSGLVFDQLNPMPEEQPAPPAPPRADDPPRSRRRRSRVARSTSRRREKSVRSAV